MKTLAFILIFISFQAVGDCIGSCYMPKLQFDKIGNLKQLMDQSRLINDSRQIYSKNSPNFLESYGKIYVKGTGHCTGNLITREGWSDDPASSENDIVTTASHCFDKNSDINNSYIYFTNKKGKKFKRHFTILKIAPSQKSGDWAILKLDTPIAVSDITPIVAGKDIHDIYNKRKSFTLGGYSADSYKGAGGKNLTYDQNCEAMYADDSKILTNCSAFHGASGGALIIQAKDEQGNIKPYFIGVAKAGYNKRTDRIQITSQNYFITNGELLDILGVEQDW